MKKLSYILFSLAAFMGVQSCVKENVNHAEGIVNDKADIYVVRNAYRGQSLTLNASNVGGATYTSGTVISDKTTGNVAAGSFVIQGTSPTSNSIGDLTTGIIVDMGSGTDVPYVIGDSVLINIIGAKLHRTKGGLTLSGITGDKVTKIADGKTAIVRPVTLAMLTSQFHLYESTLVSVHADVADHSAGTTFKGNRPLNDHTATAYLLTRDGAGFAAGQVPLNARFTGIAAYKNDSGDDTTGALKGIYMRNLSDTAFTSGQLYPGFPESFETPDAEEKASYNITATANNIDLSTGNWKLQQAILGNTILSDKINFPGKQAVRMQQNLTTSALLQMNFDVTQGASKVTVFYGRYGNDPASTFQLEYSINGGTSWIAVLPRISDMPENGSKQAAWKLNLPGNVRFRINKIGLGASSATVQNGRLSLEDIAVYKL